MKADNPMLQQKMKPRHLTMIAVGGSIGTGLFVGSGAALHSGGPGGVIVAWILMGIMLINVTQVCISPLNFPRYQLILIIPR
jgi:yeast amino acid transporter